MRIAVTCPDDHSVSPGATFAYALGRIEEGVHNAPPGHPAQELEDYVLGLVEQARAEFPGHEVRVERLVDRGDGTGEWIAADEFDPKVHTSVGPGNVKSTQMHVTSEQRSE